MKPNDLVVKRNAKSENRMKISHFMATLTLTLIPTLTLTLTLTLINVIFSKIFRKNDIFRIWCN